MKANPRDFLINTDYEMDKIVFFAKGKLNQNWPYIKHNLDYVPLLFGIASFDSDFNDVMTIPYTQEDENGATEVAITLFALTDTKEAWISYYDHGLPNGEKRDLYYMIFAFEPSGQRAKAPKTAKGAKELILDTDYNYCKLFKKGVVNGGETLIEHNLGYVPFVLAWLEYAGDWDGYYHTSLFTESVENVPDSVYRLVQVTDKYIFIKTSNLDAKVHYRIYYDEA